MFKRNYYSEEDDEDFDYIQFSNFHYEEEKDSNEKFLVDLTDFNKIYKSAYEVNNILKTQANFGVLVLKIILEKEFAASYSARRDVNSRFANPFSELKMRHKGQIYKVTSEEFNYKNLLEGYLPRLESDYVSEALNGLVGYKAYLGQHSYKKYEKPIEIINAQVQAVNERWNCLDSLKIQEWYLANNTEYRTEIDTAKENKLLHMVEIYISDFPTVEELKKFLATKLPLSKVSEEKMIPYIKHIIKPAEKEIVFSKNLAKKLNEKKERVDSFKEFRELEWYEENQALKDDYLYLQRVEDGEE